MSKTTNFQIYTAIQSLEDLVKTQYVEQQKQFDNSEEVNNGQLFNMINSELVGLNDHSSLISDKLDTLATLLKSHNFNTHDKSNFSLFRYPKAIKQIKKRAYNEQIHYLHRKIKLHHNKKIAYNNKTLPANQMVGEEYLPDVTNTPTAGNNPIIIDVDYFMKDWEVQKNTNELAFEQPWTHEVITDIVAQYIQHLHKDYLALKKNPDAFSNRNIKQRHDNRLTLKSKALLKALDQYSDEENLHYPKEEIKHILHKRCMSPELTDEDNELELDVFHDKRI
ncbi:5526_t:CDS:2, partial [Dentiscutata heterogama]